MNIPKGTGDYSVNLTIGQMHAFLREDGVKFSNKPVFGTDEYFAQCYPSQLVRNLYSVWLWEYPADKTDEEAFWTWCKSSMGTDPL